MRRIGSVQCQVYWDTIYVQHPYTYQKFYSIIDRELSESTLSQVAKLQPLFSSRAFSVSFLRQAAGNESIFLFGKCRLKLWIELRDRKLYPQQFL
jgi:hypothetical protein